MRRRKPTSRFGRTGILLSGLIIMGLFSSALADSAQALGLPPVLLSVSVSPAVDSISVGQTQPFTATGTYSNLSTKNLTTSVTWSTSSATTATVSSGGLATGVGTGVATVTATDPTSGFAGTAVLTVTPAVLLSISVAPGIDSLGVGQSQQFTATGTYSDLSTKNLTADVTWSTSSAPTATVSSGGLATGVGTGVATVTATDPTSGAAGTAVLTVTPAVLLSISVSPAIESLGVGQTQQFTATGLYSDLSTKNLTADVTWSASSATTATVSSGGLATGVGTGVATVTATDPTSGAAGTAVLTVTPAVLLSISVSPAIESLGVGQTQQFTATGTYSDLSTKNLTADVTWSTSSAPTATVSSGGLATGVGTGVATVTATDPTSGAAGTAVLTVTPAVLLGITVAPGIDSLGVGQTQQFTATGTYSDLSTKNLTADVTWSTSSATTATVSSGGLATGVGTGVATVTATDPTSGAAGTAVLTVTPAVLLSISVSPGIESLGVGQTQQFTATGTYSDLSTKNLTADVTWSTSSAPTATVSSGGLATGVGTGVATVTATDPTSGFAGTAALTVTPAVLLGITVAPAIDSLGVGQTQQFTATGLYSDLSTENLTDSVTWSTSSATTAAVSSGGLATGVGTGVATVTATDPTSGAAGTAVFTVTPAVLLSISVSPGIESLGVGQTQQFTATGLYSDLSTENLTDSVTWSTSSATTATVSSGGLATGVGTGVATVTATDPTSGAAGTAVLTVTPGTAPVPTLSISPSHGRRHSRVTLTGTGFSADQTVTITYMSGRAKKKFASSVLCATTVATNGSFSCTGVIPRKRRAGRLGQKTIVGAEPDGATASVIFTLT